MGFIGHIYRLLYGRLMRKPTNFSWVLEKKVAGSGRPTSISELKWIKGQGVDVLVSLTEEPIAESWVSSLGISYFHIPIEDHSVPPPELVHKIVKTIEKEVQASRSVLVHCGAGQGRTGTVLASFLVHHQNLRPDDAIKEVRRLRPGSVEPQQERAVHDYYEWLNSKKEGKEP